MQRKIEIQKGVPVPVPERQSRYSDAIDAMTVGDSVLFADAYDAKLFSNALSYRRIKYAKRKMPEGFRVWRLS